MTRLYKPVYYSHSLHPGGNALTHSLAVVDTISAVTDAFFRRQCKKKKFKGNENFPFGFHTDQRITNGHHQGPRLSVKGLSVVPPFRVQGRRPRGAPGRMFFFPIIPPANGSRSSTSPWNSLSARCQSAFPPFPPSLSQGGGSLTNRDVQLRASRKESCPTEFKVGEKLQFGNNLVFFRWTASTVPFFQGRR